jgi:formylglycine-generating enzyme required for sulfatase activity
MVTVGDPGNAKDPKTSCGSVARAYRIGKYEVTNAQYAEFLNAVDPNGTNPNNVYNGKMGSDARGGISFDAGGAVGSKYSTRANMADKPVNFLSWYDALRLANWLHNGQPTDGSGTEDGAYDMSRGADVVRKEGAKYWLPSEDEWYKAAYYRGGGSAAGYWTYPTGSHILNYRRSFVQAVDTGDVGNLGDGRDGPDRFYPGNTPVPYGKHVNWGLHADWDSDGDGTAEDGNVTTVGTNGDPSPYGTFDQGGNVYEWNETFRTGTSGARCLRGGAWNNSCGLVGLTGSYRFGHTPSTETDWIGFRVASGIPDMSSVPSRKTVGARTSPSPPKSTSHSDD